KNIRDLTGGAKLQPAGFSVQVKSRRIGSWTGAAGRRYSINKNIRDLTGGAKLQPAGFSVQVKSRRIGSWTGAA
ncbi:hypothetical protein CKF46_37145, partial [Klebsiella pneumoniae]